MAVMCMLSVAGYAWNFDCAQPPLVLRVNKKCPDLLAPPTYGGESGWGKLGPVCPD